MMNNKLKLVMDEIKSSRYQGVSVKFELTEFGYDWILTPLYAPLLNEPLGGLERYVVPKNGKGYFLLGSGERASATSGIGAMYFLDFLKEEKAPLMLAKLLSKSLLESSIDLYKKIKLAPLRIGPYYISEPLELKKALQNVGTSIALIRPNDLGGYPADAKHA